MDTHQLLGQLSSLHQMMGHLLTSVPETDAYHRYHPELPPLAWLFGRCVYLETYWIREVVAQDDDMTARVRALFGHGVSVDEQIIHQLPPREHLLNWALELQEENLMRLANPAMLPEHPLLSEQRLLPLLLQQQALLVELMMAQLSERQLAAAPMFRVSNPLTVTSPSEDHTDIHKGHYRIGAKHPATALDNELPPNSIELDAFRIDLHPVTNGAWMGFLKAGGYSDSSFWSHEGWGWRQKHRAHPHHWRQDDKGDWFGIGLGGPFELQSVDAVSGISQYEAHAYANWVSSLGGKLEGAVVQHEYQWEVAVRTRAITEYGRAWEWCSNPFHRYDGYLEPAEPEAATPFFDAGHFSLRGGCLHSQRIQRRSSYRHHAPPEQRIHFSGTRLVFPASKMPWHK